MATRSVICLGACVFSLILLNRASSAVTTNKTLLTFHSQTASWNTANNVCRKNSGRLAKINTFTIEKIVLEYQQSEWGNLWNSYWLYWIGLHDSEIPNLSFAWTGQCEKLDNSYSNWNSGVWDPTIHHCVVADKHGGWTLNYCGAPSPFLCENLKGRESHLEGVQVIYNTTAGKYTSDLNDMTSKYWEKPDSDPHSACSPCRGHLCDQFTKCIEYQH